MAADVEGRRNKQKPERDAPATDWSKMLQPLFRAPQPVPPVAILACVGMPIRCLIVPSKTLIEA
jgi:hypothetical protein